MKIKLTKYILGILAFTFMLTSCDKSDDVIATSESAKQDILTFKSSEEFITTLNQVNAMKTEDRIAWEKLKGFKSFGTICDDFYATIDPDKFKSEDEAQAFINANSDYIYNQDHSDGSKCCVSKEFDNPAKYLMNDNKMYVVGNIAFKQFDEGCVSSNIANLEVLKATKDFASIKSNPAFVVKNTASKAPIQKMTTTNLGNSFGDWDNAKGYNGSIYRIEIYLRTGDYCPSDVTYRNTTCLIEDFKYQYGSYWLCSRFNTFNVSVTTVELNNASPVTYTWSGTREEFDYRHDPWIYFARCTGNIALYPYFTHVNYSAINDEKCAVAHTYN